MMKFLSHTSPELFKNKRVLVRLDLNVPLDEQGLIQPTDTDRIDTARKTLDYLRDAGAQVIIISHIGRDPKQSLAPVTEMMNIPLFPLSVDKKKISEPVIMLENIRSDTREEARDNMFAQELASDCDYFVNDAFAVSHRPHTSIVEIPKLLPSFVGFQLEQEITYLDKIFSAPHPAIAIVGGAKFETKLPVIKQLLPIMDRIIIGGALANNFYKEQGYEIGRSLIDPDALLGDLVHHEKIIIADTVIVESEQGTIEKKIQHVTYDEKIVDIAPSGLNEFATMLTGASLVVWNGPMGNYENGFVAGTQKIIELIAEGESLSIIGGGDSVALIKQLGMQNKFSFLSTGGGAMLEYIAHKTLPGIQALDNN